MVGADVASIGSSYEMRTLRSRKRSIEICAWEVGNIYYIRQSASATLEGL